MDPVTLAAIIAASSALGGGLIATGGNLALELTRRKTQRQQDQAKQLHETRQHRYDERKESYEEFFTALANAERETLELEAREGLLPGDMGYDPEYTTVDSTLARLQFVASDECLSAAEKCSRAFYAWGWGAGSHTELYASMNEFTKAVRADLDVNTTGYLRPQQSARRRALTSKPDQAADRDGA